MQFGPTEDDAQLAESTLRMFARTFTDQTAAAFRSQPALDPSWCTIVGDAGVLALCADPEVGGLGLGATQAIEVARQAGHGLVTFPVSEVIIAASYLAERQDVSADAALDGRELAVFCEAQNLSFERDERDWLVSGIIERVPFASSAATLVVHVETADGPKAMRIRTDQRGIKIAATVSTDRHFVLEKVILDQVRVAGVLMADRSERLLQLSWLLNAAECLGAAEYALDHSVEYAKTRTQFGKPIGSFQALKHTLANAAISLEAIRVSLQYAAWAHDQQLGDAATAVHVAKAYANEAARAIAETAIQVHGGIGFTWEFEIHHFLRRIVRLGATGGTAMVHREHIAKSQLGLAAAGDISSLTSA